MDFPKDLIYRLQGDQIVPLGPLFVCLFGCFLKANPFLNQKENFHEKQDL